MKKDAYISYPSRLEAILDATHAATWEWNVQTGEVILNYRWATMLGYTLAELEPLSFQTWVELVHPADLKQSNLNFDKYFQGELTRYHCLVRLRHKQGHWVIVEDSGKIVTKTVDGQPEWVAGTHIDVTEKYQAELILNKLSRSIPSIIFCMAVPIVGSIHLPFISEHVTAFLDTEIDDLRQSPGKALSIVHDEDFYLFLKTFKTAQLQLTPWLIEFRLKSLTQPRWLQIHAMPESSEDGVNWYGVVNDIHKQKMLEQQLIEQAQFDELTQLPNRRILIARLSELIKLASRNDQLTAVAVIDLDKFKYINDVYGHITGDNVLIQFAHELRSRLRETDIFGRFGGEEFLILMPNTSSQSAAYLVKAILDSWRKHLFFSDNGQQFSSSFSAGITEIRSTDTDFTKIIARADDAMYDAKAGGRAKVEVFSK